MTAVVIAAVIGAAGTVLGAWIQGRAQRRAGGNTPGQAEQAVSCAPGRDGAAAAPGRDLPAMTADDRGPGPAGQSPPSAPLQAPAPGSCDD